MAEDRFYLCPTTLIVLALCMCAIQSTESATKCSFTPANNQSLVDEVYHYFDEDSDVIVVEYVINLNVTSPTFDWSKYSDYESFQPWRWFRTQGSGNSRLLLAFYYYYGLFKDYLTFDTRKVHVTLNPEPPGCVENIDKGELDGLLRDYLLRDFDINPKAVRHPYTQSDDVNVCSMYLHDVDGWGRLTYRCCQYDEDDDTKQKQECHDVYNDGWVWALRALIITFTIILFLHLPSLIPGGHQVNIYDYSPSQRIQFNLVTTKNPDKFSNLKNATNLKLLEWRKMPAFKTEVDLLEPEVIYDAHVKRAVCAVNNDRMAHKHKSPVSFSKSFFDAFVLCKIRHNSPVEECCHTSICGEMCCRGTCCPPWHSWLRALRVIILMSLVALPALPLFYVITAENLDFQELDEAHEDRGLHRTFNFYPGKIISRVFVGILSFMYVLNTVILVLDGATDGRLTKLYSNVLSISKKNSSLRLKTKNVKTVIRKFFKPVQRYGIYVIPLWLVGICFLPVVLILLYVFDSPMARILIHAFRKLLERLNVIARSDLESEERFLSFWKIFSFLISLISVFIVITLGINLLVHVTAMIIVEIVADARIAYQILPVIFFLLFYIRDAFHRTGEKYKKYLDTVLRILISKEEDELQQAIRKPWPLESNKMFQVSSGEFKESQKSNDPNVPVEKDSSATSSAPLSGPGVLTPLFSVYRGDLWIRLQRVVLLLSKTEMVSTPRKFLFQACEIDCFGVPGKLEVNFIMACLDFFKIAIFLLFVFIAVMAYGSIYSISPTNHLFITLISGLVPLIARNIFKDNDEAEMVDGGSFRYESQLDQKIQSFVQGWELQDLIIDSVKRKAEENDVTDDQPLSSKLASARMANYRQPARKPILSTLILDLNEESSEFLKSEREHPNNFSRNLPKQRSTRVGNSSSICCGSRSDGAGGDGSGGDRVKNDAATDDVDSRNPTSYKTKSQKNYENRYYTENERERGGHVRNSNEDGSNYYELSQTGKWKRKRKRPVSSAGELSMEREMKDLSRREPIVHEKEAVHIDMSQNIPIIKDPPERPKVRRHESSRDFRRFRTPPALWSEEGQGHSNNIQHSTA